MLSWFALKHNLIWYDGSMYKCKIFKLNWEQHKKELCLTFLLPLMPSSCISPKACRSNLMLTFNYTTGVSKQNFDRTFMFHSLFDHCLRIPISNDLWRTFSLLTTLHRWRSFCWISQESSILWFFEEAMQQGQAALGGKRCELLIARALPLAMQPRSGSPCPRHFVSAFMGNIQQTQLRLGNLLL